MTAIDHAYLTPERTEPIAPPRSDSFKDTQTRKEMFRTHRKSKFVHHALLCYAMLCLCASHTRLPHVLARVNASGSGTSFKRSRSQKALREVLPKSLQASSKPSMTRSPTQKLRLCSSAPCICTAISWISTPALVLAQLLSAHNLCWLPARVLLLFYRPWCMRRAKMAHTVTPFYTRISNICYCNSEDPLKKQMTCAPHITMQMTCSINH